MYARKKVGSTHLKLHPRNNVWRMLQRNSALVIGFHDPNNNITVDIKTDNLKSQLPSRLNADTTTCHLYIKIISAKIHPVPHNHMTALLPPENAWFWVS